MPNIFSIFELLLKQLMKALSLNFQAFLRSEKDFIDNNLKNIYIWKMSQGYKLLKKS